MLLLKWSKSRAKYLMDCLSTGKPMHPEELGTGWLQTDMLNLAAACYAFVFMLGTITKTGERVNLKGLNFEQKEHYYKLVSCDISAAIEILYRWVVDAMDGDWEKKFDGPEIEAVVETLGSDQPKLTPRKGFKRDTDEEG